MEKEELIGKISGSALLSVFVPQAISSILGVLIGTFLFIVNIISAINNITYIETTAKIVDARYDKEMELYIPVYEYDFNGEVVRVDGIGWSDKNDIEIGSEETINYNPKNYKQFNVGSRKDSKLSWFICFVCLFASVGFLYVFINVVKKFKAHGFNLFSVAEEAQAIEEERMNEALYGNKSKIGSILALIFIIAIIIYILKSII